MADVSFSLFEHDFCVELPVEASESVGFDGHESGGFMVYCAQRSDLGEVTEQLWPEADPPLLADDLLESLSLLESVPFACKRYEEDGVLPRSVYALTWTPAGTTDITGDSGRRSPRGL